MGGWARVALTIVAALAVWIGAAGIAGADGHVLQGRISDAAGQPLPAVTVSVKAASGQTVHAHASNDGHYRIEGLSAGTYEVSFELTPTRATSRPPGRSASST